MLSGYITGDPYWLSSSTSFLDSLTQNTAKLKIAFATSVNPGGKADNILAQQVDKIAHLLEDMGHSLTEACPDFSALIEPYTIIWRSSVISTGFPEAILSPMNKWLMQNSPDVATYIQSLQRIQVISRQIVAFFNDFDLLLLPVYLQPTIKIGEWADLSPEETLNKISNWIIPCPPFNASGQPAIAIPTGFTTEGLPVGVQLIGKPADEITILQIAYQLEQTINN